MAVARAPNGHAAERAPRSARKSRRLSSSSRLSREIVSILSSSLKGWAATADVRLGSKADIGLPTVDVRFTPKSGHC
jgi:hypothetical protein